MSALRARPIISSTSTLHRPSTPMTIGPVAPFTSVVEPKPSGTFPTEPQLSTEPRGSHDTSSLHLLDSELNYLREDLGALTAREREVVISICRGGTNEQVAERLCIALPTLRTHLMRLNQKLGTSGKGDVVRHVAAVLLAGYRTGTLQPAARNS